MPESEDKLARAVRHLKGRTRTLVSAVKGIVRGLAERPLRFRVRKGVQFGNRSMNPKPSHWSLKCSCDKYIL